MKSMCSSETTPPSKHSSLASSFLSLNQSPGKRAFSSLIIPTHPRRCANNSRQLRAAPAHPLVLFTARWHLVVDVRSLCFLQSVEEQNVLGDHAIPWVPIHQVCEVFLRLQELKTGEVMGIVKASAPCIAQRKYLKWNSIVKSLFFLFHRVPHSAFYMLNKIEA